MKLRALVATAVGLAFLLVPTAAAADVCGDTGTPPTLIDSGGYIFDFYNASTPGPYPDLFATLSNGGAISPPAPTAATDSWDEFGSLLVGGTGAADFYTSPDNNSCSNEDGGRQHVYPVVSVNGLNVQRKIFVAASGLPGARILNLITNPGGSPVTTTVQVGSLAHADGSLGSDHDTAVRASSNGDATTTPADYWAVTSDSATFAGDPTLAHVADGVGGSVKANLFQVGTGTDEDSVAWGWTVTVPAHATVGLMSFEVQQVVAGRSAPIETQAAVSAAQTYESAPTSTLYQGLTPAEASSVVNWPPPTVPKTKCKKHKKHHGKKSAASAKKHKKGKCKKHKKK